MLQGGGSEGGERPLQAGVFARPALARPVCCTLPFLLLHTACPIRRQRPPTSRLSLPSAAAARITLRSATGSTGCACARFFRASDTLVGSAGRSAEREVGREPGRLPACEEERLAGREPPLPLPAALQAEEGREEGRLGGRASLEPRLAACGAACCGWAAGASACSSSSVAWAGVGAGASGAEATAASSSSPSSCWVASSVCPCGSGRGVRMWFPAGEGMQGPQAGRRGAAGTSPIKSHASAPAARCGAAPHRPLPSRPARCLWAARTPLAAAALRPARPR